MENSKDKYRKETIRNMLFLIAAVLLIPLGFRSLNVMMMREKEAKSYVDLEKKSVIDDIMHDALEAEERGWHETPYGKIYITRNGDLAAYLRDSGQETTYYFDEYGLLEKEEYETNTMYALKRLVVILASVYLLCLMCFGLINLIYLNDK